MTKGLILPPNIELLVSKKEGVIPSRVVEVNCTITLKGNRRGMCSYHFCKYPMQLLVDMIWRLFLDDVWEDSITFCILENKLVVVVGIDKSDKDLVGT